MKLRPESKEENKYRPSSLELKKPGLLALLFKRSFTVGLADYLFHIGVYGSIVTGAIMELCNFVPWFASVFNGAGWIVSWSHGATGFFLLLGGAGFVVRYVNNRYFRLAWGRIFYLDIVFLSVIAITGVLQVLPVFGLISVVGFTPYLLTWIASIHVVMIYGWIVASLFLGGAVRHALATVVWRLASPQQKFTLFSTFSDACGRCGRCIEVCSLYEATKGSVEAPVFRLRRLYKTILKRSLTEDELRSAAEQATQCTLCGLCVGVCPFSFNFVDLSKELLAYANKVIPLPSIGK
jgi:ferredoxin